MRRYVTGFTLLELMVVVMIISVLAAVSIPMFSKYIRRSKVTEAYINIRKIYDGQMSYYQEEHTTSSGSVLSPQFVYLRPVPKFPPKKKKRFGNFERFGWPTIKFSPDGPVYYSYHCDASPGTYPPLPQPPGIPPLPPKPPDLVAAVIARALGDLDGDGKFSLFERIAVVRTGTGTIEGFPGVFSFDELE